jgi:hypothetical protein
VVETFIHEIGHEMLEQLLVLSAEQVAGTTQAKPVASQQEAYEQRHVLSLVHVLP